MLRLTALAAYLIPAALAGTLQEAVFNRLVSLQGDQAQACNLCPYDGPATIPSGVPRTVEGCCSGNFRDCGSGDARCRLLGEYTIPVSNDPAAGVEQCPDSVCPCQQSLASNQNVSLKLCPTPKDCCASCRCIGDPHCVSFARTPASFVVCDVRDGNCDFPPDVKTAAQRCAKLWYDGAQCVMRKDQTGHTFCQYPLSKPPPTMNMYSKQYTLGGILQNFKVLLQLSVYGATEKIAITDGGQTYNFGFAFTKQVPRCTLPPNVANIASIPRLINGVITLDKLTSGVGMVLTCIIKRSMWGTRWEVTSLQDDYLPGDSTRDGFCQTSNITESAGPMTTCQIDRRLLGLFEQWGYYCLSAPSFQTQAPAPADDGNDAGGWSTTVCKRRWCDKPVMATGTGKNWIAAGFSSSQQCQEYVSEIGDNFLRAVCTVAPGVHISGPSACEGNTKCKDCMDDVKDYPDEAVDILKPATLPRGGTRPGSGPAAPCNPTSLLNLGLENAQNQLPLVTGGVKITFQAQGSQLIQLIWEATDAEIAQFTSDCGCVDFLQASQDVLFTSPGTYRIEQCFPDNAFILNKCSSAPTYLVEADYPTQPARGDLSYPYGTLVGDNALVCSAATECPPNSQCCIWPWGGPGWRDCLGSLVTEYPNCGKNINCPGCP